MAHKTVWTTIKSAGGDPTGEFTARIATWNLPDHDGDIVVETSFTNGVTVPFLWGHNLAEMPLGKCVVQNRPKAQDTIVHGRVFTATSRGKDCAEILRNLVGVQEFSWTYDILKSRPRTVDGKSCRVLEKVDVYEVSAVFKGASVNPVLLEAKTRDEGGSELAKRIAQELLAEGIGPSAAELRAKIAQLEGEPAREPSDEQARIELEIASTEARAAGVDVVHRRTDALEAWGQALVRDGHSPRWVQVMVDSRVECVVEGFRRQVPAGIGLNDREGWARRQAAAFLYAAV